MTADVVLHEAILQVLRDWDANLNMADDILAAIAAARVEASA